MKLSWEVKRVNTKFEFKIARSAESYYDTVIVTVGDDQSFGLGEAQPNKRYEGGAAEVVALLEGLQADLAELPLNDAEQRQAQLEALLPDSFSLQAAIDTAYWDLYGRRLGKPLYQIFGAEPTMVTSSYTIGISELDMIPEKLAEADQYPLLKIKLGTDYDYDIMRTIRAHTDKVLRVDVNEGWKTFDAAKRGVDWLVEENVEFLEQPMPAEQLDDIAALREYSPIPIVADENSVRPEDIPPLVGIYDGINIKLMKCGGLTNARKMVELARKYELDIMMGCMLETSVGITAMAHLGSFARWLDLDGNVLISNDPFIGLKNDAGVLALSQKPGIGVEERT